MGKKHLLTLGAGILLGFVLAPSISKVPLVSKLPQF